MRDLIWTLIVIWLVYRVVNVFKNTVTKGKQFTSSENSSSNTYTHTTTNKKDVDYAIKKGVNKEGEYVDYEEIR